jgi:ABC-type Na+ efflux pump permease subunit
MANKTLLVAQREYLDNVRTKTFWLGILSFPLIFVLAIGIGWVMQKTKQLQKFTVLDFTPTQIGKQIDAEARQRDFQRTIEELLPKRPTATGDGAQPAAQGAAPEPTLEQVVAELDAALARIEPDHPLRSLVEQFRQEPELVLQASRAAQSGKLGDMPPKLMGLVTQWATSLSVEQQRSLQSFASARRYEHVSHEQLGIAGLPKDEQRRRLNTLVNDGKLFAYFVLDNDPLVFEAGERRKDAPPDFTYVSNNLTDDQLRDWYAGAATQVLRKQRIAKADIPPQKARWIQETANFVEVQVDASGATKAVDKTDKGNKFAPVAFVYLLWIAVFTAAQMLLTNTVEEKSNRIIEVLLSSVSPGELMAGKIWGIGATGLTIVGSWVVFGVLGVWLAPKLVPSFGEYNLLAIVGDPLYLISFVAYFLTGYLLFAAILVAIGSVCNSLKEAQNLLQPVFLLLMLPLFAMVPIVQEPNGLMARVFTYIPLYTPFAMMNRASGPPPAIEYAITSGMILFSVWFAFKMAGKIFRVGVLMTGNPPKLKEILGWLKEK